MTFKLGDTCFLPFWILLEHLDNTIPDPFVKCTILAIYERAYTTPDGQSTGLFCDLNLGKDDLIAQTVPVDYLISATDLPEWAKNISDWFLAYKA